MSSLRKEINSPQSSEPGETAETLAFFSPGSVQIVQGVDRHHCEPWVAWAPLLFLASFSLFPES